MLALGSQALMTSCDEDLWKFEDDSKGAYKPSEGDPISTTLENSGEFVEWVKVLNYSDTYSILNALYTGGTGKTHKYTLFAPTDEALQSFYKEKGVGSIEELGKEYATALVKTMTYDGDSLKFTEMFTSNTVGLTFESEANENIFVNIDTENEGFTLYNNSSSQSKAIHLSRYYIKASNGFVYTADGVLTPLVETVYDRIVKDGKSTIMDAALKATGYDQKLSVVADTTYVLGQRKITHYNYTLLNVSDETFAACGIRSLEDLKSAIVARSAEPEVGVDSLLRQYVEYHLFDAKYFTTDFTEMIGADTVRIWSPMASNQIMLISKEVASVTEVPAEDGSMVQDTLFSYVLNTDDLKGQAFVFEKSNVFAKNGLVHQLASWVPVYEPKQTTVVWDLADYSEVRNSLGVLFQPSEPVASETKVDLSRLSCYEVETGPDGSSNNGYTSLCYVTCKSNLKNCLHNDRVVFNMGYQGSVTMNTPTLVKGKYRVSISMAYLTDLAFIRTMNGCKGGLMRLTVDGENQILTAPYTQITKSLAGVYETDLYAEIEFTETKSHKFKFVIMDPAASTNNKFSLQFDAITFTPIE